MGKTRRENLEEFVRECWTRTGPYPDRLHQRYKTLKEAIEKEVPKLLVREF